MATQPGPHRQRRRQHMAHRLRIAAALAANSGAPANTTNGVSFQALMQQLKEPTT